MDWLTFKSCVFIWVLCVSKSELQIIDNNEPPECVSGRKVPSKDPCNHCICLEGRVYCTHTPCPMSGQSDTSTDFEVVKECEENEVIPPRPPHDNCNTCICYDNLIYCTIHKCDGSASEVEERLTDNELPDKQIPIEPYIDMLPKNNNKLPTKLVHTHAYNGFKQDVKVHSNNLKKDATKWLLISATSLDNSNIDDKSKNILAPKSLLNQHSKKPLDLTNVKQTLLSKLITTGSHGNETISAVPVAKPVAWPVVSKYETTSKTNSAPALLISKITYDMPSNSSKLSLSGVSHLPSINSTMNVIKVSNVSNQPILSTLNSKTISKVSILPHSQENRPFESISVMKFTKPTHNIVDDSLLDSIYKPSKLVVTLNDSTGQEKSAKSQFVPISSPMFYPIQVQSNKYHFATLNSKESKPILVDHQPHLIKIFYTNNGLLQSNKKLKVKKYTLNPSHLAEKLTHPMNMLNHSINEPMPNQHKPLELNDSGNINGFQYSYNINEDILPSILGIPQNHHYFEYAPNYSVNQIQFNPHTHNFDTGHPKNSLPNFSHSKLGPEQNLLRPEMFDDHELKYSQPINIAELPVLTWAPTKILSSKDKLQSTPRPQFQLSSSTQNQHIPVKFDNSKAPGHAHYISDSNPANLIESIHNPTYSQTGPENQRPAEVFHDVPTDTIKNYINPLRPWPPLDHTHKYKEIKTVHPGIDDPQNGVTSIQKQYTYDSPVNEIFYLSIPNQNTDYSTVDQPYITNLDNGQHTYEINYPEAYVTLAQSDEANYEDSDTEDLSTNSEDLIYYKPDNVTLFPSADSTHEYENWPEDVSLKPEENGQHSSEINYPEAYVTLDQSDEDDYEDSDTEDLSTNSEESGDSWFIEPNPWFGHQPKDRKEECSDGTRWIRNCHRCSCISGQAKCFRIADCDLRPFGVPMTCKPYSKFTMGDCYTCECNGDGVAECNDAPCYVKATKVTTETLPNTGASFNYTEPSILTKPKECPEIPTCEPGTSWVSSCHECQCDENGKHNCVRIADCKLNFHSFGKPSKCKPNSRFFPKSNNWPCKECTCSDEGRPYCPWE